MNEGGDLSRHLAEMDNIAAVLASMGMATTDEDTAVQILALLPPSWETLVTVLEVTDHLTTKKVKSALLNEELKRKGVPGQVDGAYVASAKPNNNFNNRNSNNNNNFNNNNNHNNNNCNNNNNNN